MSSAENSVIYNKAIPCIRRSVAKKASPVFGPVAAKELPGLPVPGAEALADDVLDDVLDDVPEYRPRLDGKAADCAARTGNASRTGGPGFRPRQDGEAAGCASGSSVSL